MAWEDAGTSDNLTKFLNFLGKSEGASYNTVVGGSSFDDYSKHPRVVGLRTKEGPSTAAGKYQITGTTYDDVAPKLGISDFSPASQDAIAVELMKRKGALGDVLAGDFHGAVSKLGGVWASLPSSKYSQPKRDENFVNANLGPSKAGDGWEDAPAASAGWEDAPEAPKASQAPTPAATATAPAAASPAAPEQPLWKKALRGADDFVRGAADTLSFGMADEIAAKLDSLVGGGQSGKTNYADALKAQRGRDAEGGVARTVGQVAGALLPSGVAVQSAAGATRLARAGAGAATGAIQGALYGAGSAEGGTDARIDGALKGGALGAATGGALSAILPPTVKQEANRLIKGAGSEEGARLDAEIIKDIGKVADNPNQRGNPITAIHLNAVENRYVNEVNSLLSQVGKTQDVGAIRAAIQNRRVLTPEELQGLRQTVPGAAAADAIEKAQRVRSMTQPVQSSGLMAPVRAAVDLLPLPTPLHWGLKAMLGGRQTRETVAQKVLDKQGAADNVLERLGGSQANGSLEALKALAAQSQNASKIRIDAGKATAKAKGPMDSILAKVRGETQAVTEDAVASRFAPPEDLVALANKAKVPLESKGILDTIQKVEQENTVTGLKTAQPYVGNEVKNILNLGKQTQATAKATARADQVAKNQDLISGFINDGKLGGNLSKNSGGFQNMLKYVNGDEGQIVGALQELAKNDPNLGGHVLKMFTPGATLRKQDYYTLQNALMDKLGKKPLEAGALSEVTGSTVINPIAYKANVENAMQALKVAKDAAPSKELEAFASSVARIKSQPEKAQALADRLANTKDPAEAAFLTKFVEPLTKHGKK